MKSKIVPMSKLISVALLLLTACSSAAAAKAPEATPSAIKDSSVVIAEGHIIPRDKVYLSFASGGHVEKILVKKGDHVEVGQVLAELDTAPLQQIAVDQAQRHLLELTSQASIAAAEQDVANARDKLDDAQDKADSLYYPRASDTLIKNTLGKINLAKKHLARTSDTYRPVSRLPDGDERKAEALVAMTNAQIDLNNLITIYNWYTGRPNDIDAAIIQSNLDAAKADLQEAEWYLEALKGGQIPENATGNQLAQLHQAREDLIASRIRLDGARMVAPFPGTITDINVSIGQFIGPETWVVLLADFSQWYIETSDLTEIDVVAIPENQPVTVTLDAIPDVTLKGQVTSIGQSFSERQGDIVYKVTVLLDDPNPAIRWGMTADVKFER